MTSTFRTLSMALGASLGMAALAASGTSHAATIASKFKSNASGVCQSAFSAGAGAVVRTRPLAIQNEGASNAFVTCSVPYNEDAGEQPNAMGFGAYFVNNTAAPVDVSCTLVSGTPRIGANYVVKETTLPPGDVQEFIAFFPADLPDAPATIFAPNLSCGLPPGVGIQYLYYYYDRQIGT